MSYSHLNLANKSFIDFLPHFIRRAAVVQLLSAGPFSMGLLTPHPPAWHPAPDILKSAVQAASKLCEETGFVGGLSNVALGFAMRTEGLGEERKDVPTVIGFSKPSEVHEAVKVWRELHGGEASQKRKDVEVAVMGIFEAAGQMNWSWASPPPSV